MTFLDSLYYCLFGLLAPCVVWAVFGRPAPLVIWLVAWVLTTAIPGLRDAKNRR